MDAAEAGAAGAGGARIRTIAIVGGGTAGWMAGAFLAKMLAPMGVAIRLIESPTHAPIGVGEATVPPIMDFIRQLGVDEDELVRELKATFKLGIAFRDWTAAGDDYFHPFGPTASGLGQVSFPAYWLKRYLAGQAARLEAYSIQSMAAAHGKFARPVHAPNHALNKLVYALHFDAGLFARYLARYAQARGVVRTEGCVRAVALAPETGFIEALTLASGERVEADLFIDCTGFAAILSGGALKTPYEDWSHWLPCDRALAVQSRDDAPPAPYTLVTAREAGWQWRIPLQHRIGNGYVYSSAFTSDEEAQRVLSANLGGAALGDPTPIRFTPGLRGKSWNKNCIALGLSMGFLEPLEATSIHMIQRGLAMLLRFFPSRQFEPADSERYNRTLAFEFARIRDFLLLHYTQTQRAGPFWQACREIALPDSLAERLDLFRGHGRILREEGELFPVQSWLSVMIGQAVLPRAHDPLADALAPEAIAAKLDSIRLSVRESVEAMPTHDRFIRDHCRAVGA